MKLAYFGRFAPGWASERDFADALEQAGHDVWRCDETELGEWRAAASADLAVWTPASLQNPVAADGVAYLHGRTPVVGVHLDRWWGLRRERDMIDSGWVCCDLLVTADGGNDDRWERIGVRHRWMPPAIAERDTEHDPPRAPGPDVLFVGSWRNYHPEWPHRPRLVAELRRWYGGRFQARPRAGETLIRGSELTQLVRSAKIVVGDSCLLDRPRYWSDRIPETLGRGGFLVHPHVDGLDEHYQPDTHLVTWEAGDWGELRTTIDRYLWDEPSRANIAAAGREHTIRHHTWANRARELVILCGEEGLL